MATAPAVPAPLQVKQQLRSLQAGNGIAAALVQLAVLRAAESRLLIASTAAAQSIDRLPVYIP